MIGGHVTDTVLYLEIHSVYNSSRYIYAAKSRADIVDSRTAISVQSPFQLMKGLGHGAKLGKRCFCLPQIFLHSSATFSTHLFSLIFSTEVEFMEVKFR